MLTESAQYYDRMATFYKTWLQHLSEIDYDRLSPDEAVDFILLRRNIRRDRAEMQSDRSSYEKVRALFLFSTSSSTSSKREVSGRTSKGPSWLESWTA